MQVPCLHRPAPRTEPALRPSRGRTERPSPPRKDPRLPPFDPREPLPWLDFFRRLAIRFCCTTILVALVHDYNGDLVGNLNFPTECFHSVPSTR